MSQYICISFVVISEYSGVWPEAGEDGVVGGRSVVGVVGGCTSRVQVWRRVWRTA